MATRRLVGLIGLLLLVSLTSAKAQYHPQTLPVSYYAQETDFWCWAAGAEMLMAYSGTDVPQCQQANKRFSKNDCCPSSTALSYCVKGGEPLFLPFGVKPQIRPSLTPAEVIQQLEQDKKPFMFRWDYPGDHNPPDFSHFIVAIGTTYIKGELYLVVLDPHPGADMISPILSYPNFVQGSGYKLGEVIYALAKYP